MSFVPTAGEFHAFPFLKFVMAWNLWALSMIKKPFFLHYLLSGSLDLRMTHGFVVFLRGGPRRLWRGKMEVPPQFWRTFLKAFKILPSPLYGNTFSVTRPTHRTFSCSPASCPITRSCKAVPELWRVLTTHSLAKITVEDQIVQMSGCTKTGSMK